jgi:hypothetical protein
MVKNSLLIESANLQDEGFRHFLQMPRNQKILEAEQRKVMKKALKAQEVERARQLQEKVGTELLQG